MSLRKTNSRSVHWHCPVRVLRPGLCRAFFVLALPLIISGCSLLRGQRGYPTSGPLPRGEQLQDDFARGKIAAEELSDMWLVFLDPDSPARPVNWTDLEEGTVFRISDSGEKREIIRSLKEDAPVTDIGGQSVAAMGVLIARYADTGQHLYFDFTGYKTYMWVSPRSAPGRSNSELWGHLKGRYPAFTTYRDDLQEKSDEWIRTYYHNGGLRGEFPLRNGKPHGMARLLFPDGTVNWLTSYVDGVKDGPSFSFSEGRLYLQEEYRNGKLHGPARVFSEDGKVSSEIWFWNGKSVTREEFRKRSQPTP